MQNFKILVGGKWEPGDFERDRGKNWLWEFFFTKSVGNLRKFSGKFPSVNTTIDKVNLWGNNENFPRFFIQ